MKNRLAKSLCGLLLLLVGFQALAKTDLTLEQLREEVLNENLDIQIQYERYYQAQKQVSVSLGQFLPSANINLINISATLAILQSVVPTPSRWFVYQSSQELRTAEKYTTESIKLNILEGLTVNFVNLKFHEALMKSMTVQEVMLNSVYEETVKAEELGTASAPDVFRARRNLLQHRQDIFMLDSLMIAEKQALLIALNRTPSDELTLAALPDENIDVIPAKVEDGIDLALANSPELVSNEYQAEAAHYMVNSRIWSFVSFQGIGFDYAGVLSIEKSKARIIELQHEQIALKIQNQVYSAYESLDLLDKRIAIQKDVILAVKKIDDRNTELYASRAITFNKFYESKADINSEERILVKLEMERRIKITHLKRLLGFDSSLSNVDIQEYQKLQLVASQEVSRKGGKNIWITLEGSDDLIENIFSVTYNVENIVEERRKLNSESNLSLFFKVYKKGLYKVTARIQLVSGDVLTKEEIVEVK